MLNSADRRPANIAGFRPYAWHAYSRNSTQTLRPCGPRVTARGSVTDLAACDGHASDVLANVGDAPASFAQVKQVSENGLGGPSAPQRSRL